MNDNDVRVAQLLEHLATTRDDLNTVLNDVPSAAWEARPGDGWTVAQIVEHLAIVERSVGRLLGAMIPRTAQRVAPDAVSGTFVPDLRLAHIVDRSRRISTVAATLPSDGATRDASRAALAASREETLTLVRSAAGRVLEDYTYDHPALGRLDLYQWIAFIGFHEARHTEQVRETVRRWHVALAP